MGPFLIILPDPQRLPQLLALLDLRRRQLVHLMGLQTPCAAAVLVLVLNLPLVRFLEQFPPQRVRLRFDLRLVDGFVLELVAEIKDLDLDFAEAVVLEDGGVGLALLVGGEGGGVGSEGVAGFEVGEVALDVA